MGDLSPGPLSPAHDVQGEADGRRIRVDRVGVRGVKYPIAVPTRGGLLQATAAEFDLAVELSGRRRGAHMSRFFEALHPYRERLWLDDLGALLRGIRTLCGARAAYVSASFTYFIDKVAPVTGAVAPVGYPCVMAGTSAGRQAPDLTLEVSVPVTTLCPCSRAMAERGAHNQRCRIRTVVRFRRPPWLEDLVDVVEACASCGVYSMLKRPDEKWVTEHAYARPRFVEDVVRDAAKRLQRDRAITWFVVEAESHESIHDHEAYAFVKRDKRRRGLRAT